VLELDGERAAIVDKRDTRRIFIDDSGFEEIEYETVRQRKKMAYEGIVTLIVTINGESGALEATPEIVARGVRGLDESNGFINLRKARWSMLFPEPRRHNSEIRRC
jgi:ribonuclease J